MRDLLENKIFSVSEISGFIKDLLGTALGDVRLEGEVSGVRKAASGHIYFDIKDENAVINAVLFKGYAARTAEVKEGVKVLARGEITSFAKQSKYQIIVKSLVAKSAGDLFLEFERLKQKLSKEGLFDESRKQEIPAYPNVVGVVTSPTGAAVRDILSVLKRRAPHTHVIIAPTLVQGAGAAEQIAWAIENLNKLKENKPDVILAGRGGGSMEDLWSFNEEIVVRAIAASEIPVISCVGHETDFTLSDFAADLRAPTPSAAAEIVSGDARATGGHLAHLARRMLNAQNMRLGSFAHRLEMAMETPFLKNPLSYLNQREQETDALEENLKNFFNIKLTDARHRLSLLGHKITALNPGAVLKRGFSIVRKDGVLVRTANDVSAGDILDIETAKGKFTAKTEK